MLANTYEYRQPSTASAEEALAGSSEGSVTVNMTSRFMGLVVVPGHHIVKMQVEEFASQLRGQDCEGLI